MARITFKSYIGDRRYVMINGYQFEYDPDTGTIHPFRRSIKELMEHRGYTKDEAKDALEGYRNANREMRLWKKGIMKMIKIANQGPGAFDAMAGAVTGNATKGNHEYLDKLLGGLYDDDLIKIGETGRTPVFTGYVDGSYHHHWDD